jgi:hypothetical protein
LTATTSYSDEGKDGAPLDRESWISSGLNGVTRAICETLTAVKAMFETFLRTSTDPQPLREARVYLRQLRGALAMLEFKHGVHLLAAAERISEVMLRGEGHAGEACKLVLRAMNELRANIEPLNSRFRPLLNLEAVTVDLNTFISGQQDLFRPLITPPLPVDDTASDMPRAGEWQPRSDPDESEYGPDSETGMYVAQIKDRLKDIVQVMPQWWADLRNPAHLDRLHDSFRFVADRSRLLDLSELVELAVLLERLVAKVNADTIPMTAQMMYGVIEQGVLKLGVLFLQYCRPHDPPVGGAERAKLASVLADMQLLSNEAASAVAPYPPLNGPVVVHRESEREGFPASSGQESATSGADRRPSGDGDGFERLEDLLIEANLLHSQLLPRINLMRHQQQLMQTQLAYMQGADAVPDPRTATEDADAAWREKLSGIVNACQFLAKLISESEACLLKYRQATHEVQRAIFGEVTHAGPIPAT